MRVTGNTFSFNFLTHANRLNARQQELQNQAATGQRITAPGDDPAAMQRALSLRNEQVGVSQYAKNISVLNDPRQQYVQRVEKREEHFRPRR